MADISISDLAKKFKSATDLDRIGTEGTIYEISKMVHDAGLASKSKFEAAVYKEVGKEKAEALLAQFHKRSIVHALFKSKMGGDQLTEAQNLYDLGTNTFRNPLDDDPSDKDISNLISAASLVFSVAACIYVMGIAVEMGVKLTGGVLVIGDEVPLS